MSTSPPAPINKPNLTGIRRLISATRYSMQGLAAAWKHEEAFRLEASLALLLFPCSFWLGQTLSQQLILIASLALVAIVELINSAIEAVVDRIGTDMHPLSGQAKDIGSAAVFLSTLLVIVLWGLSLWDLLA